MNVIEAKAIEPISWILCFGKTGSARMDRWIPGRFKHVRAYAYLPGLNAWLFYEVSLWRTSIIVAPHNRETLARVMWPFVKDCQLVAMERRDDGRLWARFSFYCVPAIKHLIGLKSSALLPTGLYRDCLAAGGQPLGQHAELHAAAA